MAGIGGWPGSTASRVARNLLTAGAAVPARAGACRHVGGRRLMQAVAGSTALVALSLVLAAPAQAQLAGGSGAGAGGGSGGGVGGDYRGLPGGGGGSGGGTYGEGGGGGGPGAAGGPGGAVPDSFGGAGGNLPGAAGGDGVFSGVGGGGGGGGGAHGFYGSGLPGVGDLAGGAGGAGGATVFGGGGGAGGYGAVLTGAGTSLLAAGRSVFGGDGGAGGDGVGGDGGGGGDGGYGLVAAGARTITIEGALDGGDGGAGGDGDSVDGDGGKGGAGLRVDADGAMVVNAGSIVGGVGGSGGSGSGSDGSDGEGGRGIEVVGDDNTVVNAGVISGGLSGDGVTRADAIAFTGGANRLELHDGSTITGNVVAAGAGNTLALGGDADGSFDISDVGAAAQYRGFDAFEKTGAGTWTLTGTTAAVTSWAIDQGTLSVSQDANLGAAAGGLTFDGGSLQSTAAFSTARNVTLDEGGGTFRADADLTVSGTIIGAGTLTKTGAGTLTLTGTNTYTGATIVSSGTLALDGAGSIASSTVDLAAAGAAFDISAAGGDRVIGGLSGVAGTAVRLGLNGLTVNRTAEATFAGAFSGDGALVLDGAGRVTLTGDSAGFAGSTTLDAGTLVVDGVLGGALDVSQGGRLEGTGTVGDTTVAGTVAPGNSIGTLQVAGDITLGSTAVYEVEVDAAGNSDRIAATGTATLNGGSVLALAAAGDYAPETDYTILTADGGVAGTFGSVASSLAFLDPALGYGATAVTLTLTRNDTGFASVAATRNQSATAAGLSGLALGNAVYDAVVGLDAAGARAAFDSLSGEIHASAKSALIEDSRFVRDAATRRLSAAFRGGGGDAASMGDGVAVWGRAFGASGETDGDGNAATLDRTVGGFLMGADGPVADAWRLGVLAGYSRSSFEADDRASSGDSDNYHLGVYGGAGWGRLGLRLGAAYTWHEVGTDRAVAVSGFADDPHAGYDAGTAQAFGDLGYRLALGRAAVEPFAGLAHVHLGTDGFTEAGGAAALTGESADTDTTFATLGLRASTGFAIGAIEATARGAIGWRHAFGDTTPLATQSFAGGDAFTVAGAPIARNAAVIEAGVDFALTDRAALGLAYQGQIAADTREHGVTATLTVRF